MNRIEQLQEILKKDKKNEFLLYALGLEYLSLGKPLEAKKWFESVLKLNDEYLAVYYQYGKLLDAEGEEERAKELFLKGIEVAKKQDNELTLRELQAALEEIEFE